LTGRPSAAELLEHLTRAYEVGSSGVTPEEWRRLAALLARLDREGMQAAAADEVGWLRDLEQRATYALALAEVSGAGLDRALARAV
jgi:hypothetical protein